MIVYIHGFRSSPLSTKARMLASRYVELGLGEHFHCPQLPVSPHAAMELLLQLVGQVPRAELALIGSSLGGYYATRLAENLQCRAVLLNPAVTALRDLTPHVGPTTAWHSGTPMEFKPEYLEELRAYEVAHISQPERYFLIAAKGDEVLDWREMCEHYPGARQIVIDGSDHGISDFANYQDEVIEFCR